MKPISQLENRLLHGDSLELLPRIPGGSIDLIATDPPFLVNYQLRDGRNCYANDDPKNADWLPETLREMYRVLKSDAFCLCFYGYPHADQFLNAFRRAGFSIVGHLVWQKSYVSGTRYTRRTHEAAYLLAKGRPRLPASPIPDVLPWGKRTANRIHPCQKPVSVFKPIIEAFSKAGDLVLDPFAGSASSAVAAKELGRHYLAIELDWRYFQAAHLRLLS